MSEAFKEAQDRWCESLISDADLCDAVAVVGPGCQRVPFIRAHLATISKPLKAALYGEFREGQTRELVLKDVTVDAFDVIIRSAYHLEPNLTPQKALHALKAAKLYMIEDLEKYCWHYLQHLEGLDCTLILQTMTESLKLSLDLPEEVQHTSWSKILAQSLQVVQSPFFVETHGLIIARISAIPMTRPKVRSIVVHGKKARTPIELAIRAVEQLSKDLFITPAMSSRE